MSVFNLYYLGKVICLSSTLKLKTPFFIIYHYYPKNLPAEVKVNPTTDLSIVQCPLLMALWDLKSSKEA